MRWKALPLIALLLVGPGLALAADSPKSYPAMDTCMTAEHVPCIQQSDGTWIPRPAQGGGGGGGHQLPSEPKDEYLAMRQRRAAQSIWNGAPDIPIVIVDMDLVNFPDAQPYLDNEINRVRVPIRFVAEAMGAKVEWEPTTQTVTIAREGLEIKLGIDQDTATVNGRTLQIDAPPKLVQDRTMVPLRFISEAFGSNVDWVGTDEPVPDRPGWGDYQVWIWIPWGYFGTANIHDRILVYKSWWHRASEDH